MIEIFRNYGIINKIGNKPLRNVYRAYDLDDSENIVVLKIFTSACMNKEYDHEDFLERSGFIKDITHEHLVPILQIGIEEEQCYIVTPYISNRSLLTYLEQIDVASRNLSETLEICIQLGKALSYMHACGMAHANIKPANILFSDEGKIVLTDFSLAGLIDEHKMGYNSDPDAIKYMAPEQVSGQNDERGDQYALGCLGYELISGQTPFGTLDTVELRAKRTTETPPVLSTLIPGISPEVDRAFLHALAYEPNERYASMDTFVEALQALSTTLKTNASPPTPQNNKPEINTKKETKEAAAPTTPPPAFPFSTGSSAHPRKFTRILAKEEAQPTEEAEPPSTPSPSPQPEQTAQRAILPARRTKWASLLRIPGNPIRGQSHPTILVNFLLIFVVLVILSVYMVNMLTGRQTPLTTTEYATATAAAQQTSAPTRTATPAPTIIPIPTLTPTITTTPTVLPPPSNVLTNGNFENDELFPWYFHALGGTSGTATLDNSTRVEGNTSVKIDVRTAGRMPWFLQIGQESLSFTKDRTYVITFWTKASEEREGFLSLLHDNTPWSQYLNLTYTITTTWAEHTYTFTPTTTDDHVDFTFSLAQATGTVWLDNVSIR